MCLFDYIIVHPHRSELKKRAITLKHKERKGKDIVLGKGWKRNKWIKGERSLMDGRDPQVDIVKAQLCHVFQ